jgi:hypothetical protein
LPERRGAVVVLAALVAGGVLAGVLLSSSGDSSVLEWAGTPELVPVPELPEDRVLVGEVRNTTDERVRLDAEHVVVIDEAGRRLDATARFTAGFGRGRHSPADGVVGELAPDAMLPLTISWRLSESGDRAVNARIGDAVLELPAED